MTVRHMTVVRAPGTNDRAMIRIVNNTLAEMGFKIGTPIKVSYQRGIISIKKVNDKYEPDNLQQPSSPLTSPTPPSGACAGESTRHAGSGTSHPQGNQETMRDIQPLRYVLRGHFH